MTLNNVAAIQAALDDLRSKTDGKLEDFEAGLCALEKQIDSLDNSLKRVNWSGADNDNIAPNQEAVKAELRAIEALVRTGNEGPLGEIHAAMSVGSDPDGGYMVTPVLSTRMLEKLYDAVAMRRLARVETMDSGSEWMEPVDIDESGATWVGETESRPETDTPQLKMLKITLDEIYAMPKLTQRLLDDSQWNLGDWIVRKITEKFIRSENAAFVSGDGIGKPRGLLTYDTAATDDDTRAFGVLQTVNSSSATEVTLAGLRSLYWKVRAPHRRNASWLMSSDTASQIDGILDGNGRPIWRDSVDGSVPPLLLGKPVEFEENMPSVEAGALPIAFGNFEDGYTVVDRPGVKMIRDEVTTKGQVKFYAYRRVGGGLADSEAVKLLKIAA